MISGRGKAKGIKTAGEYSMGFKIPISKEETEDPFNVFFFFISAIVFFISSWVLFIVFIYFFTLL